MKITDKNEKVTFDDGKTPAPVEDWSDSAFYVLPHGMERVYGVKGDIKYAGMEVDIKTILSDTEKLVRERIADKVDDALIDYEMAVNDLNLRDITSDNYKLEIRKIRKEIIDDLLKG
jgi:hypothetical protein